MSVEQLQRFLSDSFPGPPVPYVVEHISHTGVTMRLPVGIEQSRPGGTVAGPALMALADCAAWLSIVGQIGPVALAVTTSLHIDFFRKPPLVDVVAEGSLLKLGRRLAVVEVALRSAGGNPADALVAKAQVTYSIPPGDAP
jgi:acyl-coenzyme A thioesterase PaaI-like protein